MYFHNSHNLSYSQHPQDPQSSHFPIQRLVSCHKVTTSITTLFIFVSLIFFFMFFHFLYIEGNFKFKEIQTTQLWYILIYMKVIPQLFPHWSICANTSPNLLSTQYIQLLSYPIARKVYCFSFRLFWVIIKEINSITGSNGVHKRITIKGLAFWL